MAFKNLKSYFLIILLTTVISPLSGQQTVPVGIHYQAVARDIYGKELANREIDIRFSIISDNPLGPLAYQELHSKIVTSKYGVFSIVIGQGTPIGGTSLTLSQVSWSSALHFLKVEVKFESSFIEMGTMQFLAVPYALYAQKSLEPGPQGAKGDQGVQGIQGAQGPAGLKGDQGPQGLKGDTGPQGQQGVQGLKGDPGVKGDTGPQGQQGVQGLKGDPGPQGLKGDTGPQGQQGVQGLKGDPGVKGDTGPQGQQGVQGLKGDPGDPASDDQTLSFDGTNMSISGGNTVNLSTLMLPHQLLLLGDTLSIMYGNKVVLPNQIQDLQLDPSNKLKITKNATATEIDFTRFLDDKQTLTFNSVDNTLNIFGGNTISLTSLKDDADANPLNEIQTLNFSNADNKLYISGVAAPVDLTDLKDDADASPTNEIQDLLLTGNILTVTNKTTPQPIDLSPYIQSLNFTPADNKLYISGVTAPVDLTDLKNDDDASPTNEIQDLQLIGNVLSITGKTGAKEINMNDYLDNTDNQTIGYVPSTNTITLSNGGSANLGSMVAFRARKSVAETGLTLSTDYDFVEPIVDYNDGLGFDSGTGVFTVPSSGVYSFVVSYTATGTGSSRELRVTLNGPVYETLNSEISSGMILTRSITMKLVVGDKVKVVFNRGTSSESGTGSFSGYRVY